MKLKISAKGSKSEIRRIKAQFQKESHSHLETQVKKLVVALAKETPKDTGEASRGWGYRAARPGLLEVFNLVPYIAALNRGHSRQAPSFFVETTAVKFGKPLGLIVKEVEP